MMPSTKRLHMKEAATIIQPHPPSGGTTISTSMLCQHQRQKVVTCMKMYFYLPEVSCFPWNFPSITILIGNQRRAKSGCRIGFSFLAAQFSLGRRFKFPRYFHGPTKNIWQFVKTRRRFGNWRQERSCGSVDGQRRTFQHRHSWKFTRCSRSRLKNVWNRPSRRLSRFARPRVTQNSDVLSNRRPRPRPRHVTLIPIHFNRELDLWITTASIFSLVQRYRRRLLLISLQSIGAAPRFASFATVPASLELFSRARCTEADRSSRQNEYVNRRITSASFKYLITRSLSFRPRISQASSLLAFLQWRIYDNNRASHWKYIVWKKCQRSSRCRILRLTAVTSLIPNEPIPVVSFAQSVRLAKRDTDTFRSVLQCLTSLLLSRKSSNCSSSFLQLPPFCCGTLLTCSSTLFSNDAIIVHGWLEQRMDRCKERDRSWK